MDERNGVKMTDIKMKTLECPMCGKEYKYWNLSDVPKTCGSKMCDTNYKYQQSHKDIYGKPMDAKDIGKWN
jgi:hypothetical protein